MSLTRRAKLAARRRCDTRFRHLSIREYAEVLFWRKTIDRYVAWYQAAGPNPFDRPHPPAHAKVTGHGLREDAIRTWFRVTGERYLEALRIAPDHFRGMSVLDVGCGPFPHLLAFRDCRRFGLDQLVAEYRQLGFPLDAYRSFVTYLAGSVEEIPAGDDSFDAVVAVNAIDHVDDVAAAARETTRVLRPGGILRMQVHYHPPRLTEPWSLDDQAVEAHFGHLGVRKVHETPFADLPGEKLAVWATDA